MERIIAKHEIQYIRCNTISSELSIWTRKNVPKPFAVNVVDGVVKFQVNARTLHFLFGSDVVIERIEEGYMHWWNI